MSKRKLFNADENSPMLNSSNMRSQTPLRGGIHPALISPSGPEPGAKTPTKPMDENIEEDIEKSAPDIVNGSDSDSDSMEVPGFFSVSNQKLPYTREEDELIVKYVLKGQNIFKVSSILLWKHLEAKKEHPKRTYQSLKNRFLRNIKPCLFTKFSHLIKDKATRERILSKFPELKQQIGRKETLTKIKLPERKPAPKVREEDRVSSTSTSECPGNVERTEPIELPKSDTVSTNFVVNPESDVQIHTHSDSLKTKVYQRTVNMERDGITVSVNFRVKKYVNMSRTGIYEKFQQLEMKNKLVFCPTCGRYNRPKKVSPLKSSKESDDLISNSVDSQNNSKTTLSSKLKDNKGQKRRKISEPENSKRSPCSPSLLSEVGAAGEIDKRTRDLPEKSSEIDQVSEVSNSASTRTDANELSGNNKISVSSEKAQSTITRNRSAKASNSSSSTKEDNVKNIKKAKASTSKSNAVVGLSSGKRFRDSDEDLDSLCEEAMANFRKLIDFEEEKLLIRKCLNKNFKSIGLQGVSQTNLDSYFLESTSDMETPPLTIDYETDPQNTQNETEVESTSNSVLAQNMKRMLGTAKKGKSKKS